MTRFYCTLDDLLSISPLGFKDESDALDAVRQASQFLEGKKQLNGHFIPVTATKRFDGTGTVDLFLRQYLLSITTITEDGDSLTSADYIEYPRSKHWENGPYTRLRVDPDASNLATWTNESDIVVITGAWGKFSKTALIAGETITLADGTGTVLTVANGASVSVGMILLIETEQLAITATGATSAATSLVDGAIAITDQIITVDDASEFNRYEIIKIGTEQMRIIDTDETAETLYVDRAYNGSRAQTHVDDSAIAVYRKYTIERGVNGTTAAAHDAKALYQYLPPFDVKWLCKQIAGLMIKKAQSHYAGKVGNADLGEVFYMDEFPRKPIKEIRQNYRVNIL